jgi:hypothetical protein
MKRKLFNIIIALAALLLSLPVVLAQKEDKAKEKAQEMAEEQESGSQRSLAADPAVVISMCLESGNITITGGDRREVRASTSDDAKVILRRMENPNAQTPATRLEVLVSDTEKPSPFIFGECRGASDLELEVPRGATVYVKTRDGDIEVSDVAEVRADTSSGTINLHRVAKAVEATSVDGDISLEKVNGRIRLHSFSGSIEAVDAKMVEPNDFLSARTTSGDVRLEDIEQPHVEVNSISGEVSLTGTLARGGFYDMKTMSGDITLNMPTTVNFQVTAKVSQGGEVITDFPLKYTGETPDATTSVFAISAGKITGTYGSGTAVSTINLVSFSGTLRLRKM